MAHPERILIVDDDEAIRSFLSLALRQEGYQALMAQNGALALDLVGRERFGAILLDFRMPVMDGPEFLRLYRLLPGPHAPIIMLTAATDSAEHFPSTTADACLAKPFDLDALLEIVGRAVRGDLREVAVVI